MMKLLKTTTFLLLFALTFRGYAQKEDFTHFKTLLAKGPVPADFNTSTFNKVRADLLIRRDNLSEEDQKKFIEKIHRSVDDLLHSGKVIYGDDISLYVTDVAKNLLKDQPEVFEKLRFYTVKSNITNALSTDQGIIFVTTGLLSQITSEAELAYVLSHEIVHFTENHNMDWFEYSSNQDVMDKMQNMSVYSQEKEFEADVKGIDLYLKAGYKKEYITTLFDVLAYSYLPIDEVPFPETYFNSALCKIPSNKFPTKTFDIKLDENYDDESSTHPNIKRRKDKATEAADSLINWGELTNILGQERFFYVRNLARFERLRNDMLDQSYEQALYTIFILEEKFPESLYLSRMKCQAWYGLAQLQGTGEEDYYEYDEEEYYDEEVYSFEGEVGKFQMFIQNIRGIELVTLANRVVEDCRKKFPEDKEIKEIWKRTAKELVIHMNFDFSEFSDVTYEEYVRRAQAADTIKARTFSKDELENLTKYQKIRSKRKAAEAIAVLDSSNYYKYNISDLIKDSEFLLIYEKYKDYEPDEDFEDFEWGEYDDYGLTRKEKKSLQKEQMQAKKEQEMRGIPMDLSTVIVIDPIAYYYDERTVDIQKSNKLQESLNTAFFEVSKKRNIETTSIGRGNLENLTTESFNQKNLYKSLLEQLNGYLVQNTFPVDYSNLIEIEENQENRKVVFMALVDNFSLNPYNFGKKTLRTRVKSVFHKKKDANLYMVILDVKKQQIDLKKQLEFKNGKSTKVLQQQIKKMLDTKIEPKQELNEEIFEMDLNSPTPPIQEEIIIEKK